MKPRTVKYTQCWGGTSGRGKSEGRRLRWWYMVDGLHKPIWNRIKKPLAITLIGVGGDWNERRGGQCK
jgi:hypothetical protein